jgi:hypothetical protein
MHWFGFYAWPGMALLWVLKPNPQVCDVPHPADPFRGLVVVVVVDNRVTLNFRPREL